MGCCIWHCVPVTSPGRHPPSDCDVSIALLFCLTVSRAPPNSRTHVGSGLSLSLGLIPLPTPHYQRHPPSPQQQISTLFLLCCPRLILTSPSYSRLDRPIIHLSCHLAVLIGYITYQVIGRVCGVFPFLGRAQIFPKPWTARRGFSRAWVYCDTI